MNKKESFKRKIVLLDSHAIIHRAYHAMPDFATRDGKPTGALYGVAAMVISIVNELKPDFVIACFDLPKPTFRHEAYDDYKGGRKKADSNLVDQIIESREIFEAFGIPVYDKEGFEADDIIGTFAEILKQDPENQVVIASGDMDTFQLVDQNQVVIYTLKKGSETIIYNEKSIFEKYQFLPRQIIDFKGLAGDPSDNIPGIVGIGSKTATNLILNFDSIDGIYVALEKGDEFFVENFKEGKITPRMIGLLRSGQEDAYFSRELATIKVDIEMDFELPKKSFLENIDLAKTGEVFRKYEFRALNDRLQKSLGLENTEKELAHKNISDSEKKDAQKLKLAVSILNPNIPSPTLDDILNFGKNYSEAKENIEHEIHKLDMDFVWKEIEIPIIDSVSEMTTNGFKLDIPKLSKLSVDFTARATKIEKKVFAIAGEVFNLKSTKQLSVILFEKLGLPTKGLKKTPKGVVSTKESELQKLAGDHEIIDLILEYRELSKMISTYIDNLIPMVDEGDRLHPEFLQMGTSTGRMSSKSPNIQNIPTSGQYGKQIRACFICDNDSSLVSFDYSQIELRVAAIMSQDKKLMQVFIDGKDVHTTVAEEIFGKETPENRRKAKAINFGILYGMGASSLRKSLNEGVIENELSVVDARNYLDEYFEKFSGLAKFISDTKIEVQEKGYSTTLFGRKRFFPEINSKVPFIKAMAERMAVNAPIQGTATGDIVKIAMAQVNDYLEKNTLKADVKILAQVHDELIYEIKKTAIDKVIHEIEKIMEGVLKNSHLDKKFKQVPLEVNGVVGKNWSELK